MTENINQYKWIAAKALGFTNSIANLSREERSSAPTGIYGRDYNSLLEQTKNHCAELTDLLPPPVTFYNNNEYCTQNFRINSENQ